MVPTVRTLCPWAKCFALQIVLALMCLCGARGQDSAYEQDFLPRSWDSGDGLPSDSITCLAQTPDNFLWVGTDHGLVRFDGVRFETPVFEGWQALGKREIGQLLVTTSGELWIACGDATLWHLQGQKLSRVPAGPDSGTFVITGLAEDESGEVWVATDGKGSGATQTESLCAKPSPTVCPPISCLP